MALISLEEDDDAWVTYEEYSLINKRVNDAIEEDGLQLTIYRNNLYPDYYPIEFDINPELVKEITDIINGEHYIEPTEECQRFILIYNSLVNADGILYGGFYNYEYDNSEKIEVIDFYPQNMLVEESKDKSDYDIFLNEDIETYLRDLKKCLALK